MKRIFSTHTGRKRSAQAIKLSQKEVKKLTSESVVTIQVPETILYGFNLMAFANLNWMLNKWLRELTYSNKKIKQTRSYYFRQFNLDRNPTNNIL